MNKNSNCQILKLMPSKLTNQTGNIFRVILLTLTVFLLIFIISSSQSLAKNNKKAFTVADTNQILNVIKKNRGKIVVMSVFASWCPPCIQEAPTFVQFYKKYPPKSDVLVIGVSLDEDPKALTDFIKNKRISYPVYLTNHDFIKYFDLQSIPTTIIFNRAGELVENASGIASLDELVTLVEKYK